MGKASQKKQEPTPKAPQNQPPPQGISPPVLMCFATAVMVAPIGEVEGLRERVFIMSVQSGSLTINVHLPTDMADQLAQGIMKAAHQAEAPKGIVLAGPGNVAAEAAAAEAIKNGTKL